MSGARQPALAYTHMVCGVVIEDNGKFLLVQEKQPKAYKKWNLPAGRVDAGETLEQAAIREAYEETGFEVELGEQVLVLHNSADRPVLHAYKAIIIGGELQFPEDELLDAKWFMLDEIRSMKNDLRDVNFVLGSIEAFLK